MVQNIVPAQPVTGSETSLCISYSFVPGPKINQVNHQVKLNTRTHNADRLVRMLAYLDHVKHSMGIRRRAWEFDSTWVGGFRRRQVSCKSKVESQGQKSKVSPGRANTPAVSESESQGILKIGGFGFHVVICSAG